MNILGGGINAEQECLEYVLHAEAGSSDVLFSNSPYPRDCDAGGLRRDRTTASGKGMRLSDFVAHEHCVAAHLTEAHVLALRLYSTAAFKAINAPLRDHDRTEAHPLGHLPQHDRRGRLAPHRRRDRRVVQHGRLDLVQRERGRRAPARMRASEREAASSAAAAPAQGL